MSNLSINFNNPWLLFLLIPALALTLWPYFRLSRKYRATRNRITSMVLHVVVMVLCVSVLAGCHFNYEVPNRENEIILVVDVSYSNQQSEQQKNEFIQSILDESNGMFKMGIVTFGKNAVEAASLSYNAFDVYQDYLFSLSANKPDTSATDIAGALDFAANMFDSPSSGKIVLVSDGIETDGNATSAIMQVAAQGIRVDAVHFPDKHGSEVMIVDVEHPQTAILVGVSNEFNVKLRTSYSGSAQLVVVDNNTESEPQDIIFRPGDENIFTVRHTFDFPDLHSLCFKLIMPDEAETSDTIAQNNSYYTFIDIQIHSNVLIVDGGNKVNDERESIELEKTLIESGDYDNVEVVDLAVCSTDVLDLIVFDEIILVNVMVEEMPEGLEVALSDYVQLYGGGLFTVGGDKAYDEQDMRGTTLQKLLPVDAIEYTPAMAVVIILDRSSSMGQPSGKVDSNSKSITKLELAKSGAMECVAELKPQDYCAIVTLEKVYDLTMPMTPGTRKAQIINKISTIEQGGSTFYLGALTYAATLLNSVEHEVEYKHILFISDGGASDSNSDYLNQIYSNYKNNDITLSTLFVGNASSESKGVTTLTEMAGVRYGNGSFYNGGFNGGEPNKVPQFMIDDITVDVRKRDNVGEFTPVVKLPSYHTFAGIEGEVLPKLGGFYGSRVKNLNKRPVFVPLTADNGIPLYAEWVVGNGRVGSFLCDLNGKGWSASFFNAVGKQFINNAIRGLLPPSEIEPQKITVDIEAQNYKVNLSILTSINNTEHIYVEVKDGEKRTISTDKPLLPSIGSDLSGIYVSSVFSFVSPGVYTIRVSTRDSLDQEIDFITKYIAFSYSQEYNIFVDEDECAAFLQKLADGANGDYYGAAADANLSEVMTAASRSIVKTFSVNDKKTFDPKMLFIILSIALFLLDVAVRKFKFKWPWEIVADNKLKKQLQHKSANQHQ